MNAKTLLLCLLGCVAVHATDVDPLHTGSIEFDIYGGRGMGGVGEAQLTLPDFRNFRVSGAGTGTGGSRANAFSSFVCVVRSALVARSPSFCSKNSLVS